MIRIAGMIHLFILLFTTLLITSAGALPTTSPTQQPTGINTQTNELTALQTFYNEMGGPLWSYPKNAIKWNFTCANAAINPCNVCKWSGLSCTVFSTTNTTYLQKINVTSYGVSGKLPSVFGNFTKIINLTFDNNPALQGSISSSLFSLSKLTLLSFLNTSLTGTLPSQLFSMTSLAEIYFSYTKIYGSIPTEIGNLKATLTKLSVYNNSISGTIPTEIGLCTKMTYVLIRNEMLVGTIPTEVGLLSKATYFNAKNNFLTGTIPTEFGSMTKSENLNLRNNMLVGTIPTSFCNFNKMQYFYLSVNSLTGPIPSCFNYTDVIYFFMYSNSLTGSIPTFLKYATNIQQMLLQNNKIQDRLGRIFDGTSYYKQLQAIDVSGNGITGEIPAVLFSYPELQTLNLGSNCMSTFPVSEIMCNATKLVSLILDGLDTGDSCSALYYRDMQTGVIPECLFSMPNLETLHLSGLGMKTQLPSVQKISPSLKTLSMTYNMVSGTIPASIQDSRWAELDLSYNKLTGTLATNISAENVGFHNNRMSGEIWPNLINADNINILESNMFSCPYGKPTYDPIEAKYSCGSNILNFSLAFSFAFTLFVLLFTAAFVTIKNDAIASVVRWYALSKSGMKDILHEDDSICFLSVILERFRKYILIIVLYTVFVLLPAYAILSTNHKTFTHLYGWVVGGFFLRGETAAVTQFFLFLILVMLIEYCSYYVVNIDRNWKVEVRDTIRQSVAGRETTRLTDVDPHKKEHSVGWIKKGSMSYFLTFFANSVIIGGTNVLFLYVVGEEKQSEIIAANFFFGLFKACYKKWILLAILRFSKWIVVKVKYYWANLDEEDYAWIQTLSSIDLFMCSIFQILNNIIIPWLVVLFQSKQCFYGEFFPRATVTVDYPITFCGKRCPGGLTCCAYDTMPGQFSFTPSFVYYSNCGNFLLTSYIPVMFITFAFSGIIFPVLLVLQDYFIDMYYKEPDNPTTLESICSRLVKFQLYAQLNMMYITPTQVLEMGSDHPRIVLDIDQSLLTWTTSLAVIFTFGIFYPPLAFLGLFSLALDTFVVQVEIGRLIDRRSMFSEQRFTNIIKALNDECHGLTSLIRRLSWAPGFFSSWIYAFIIFDTMSDSVGIDRGFLIAFLWFFSILVFKGIQQLYTMYRKKFKTGDDAIVNNPLQHRVDVEVTPAVNPMQQDISKHNDTLA